MRQSIRTSAAFNLLYHGHTSSLQQISSLITHGKKIGIITFTGSDQKST